MWLFDKRPITEVLFGIKIEGLLAGPSLALMSSIIYGIWSYTGYYAIILLAGLSIIPLIYMRLRKQRELVDGKHLLKLPYHY